MNRAGQAGIAVLVAICAASPVPAIAQERALVGTKNIPVWKDLKSLREGTDMISAGIHERNPALVRSLLSCFPAPGSTVVVSGSPTMGVYDVLVTSGDATGCRGAVNFEMVK